jgi:peptide/nickel transport system substrate-binding protein
LRKLAAVAALLAAMIAAGPAIAQKQGGILRAGHFDSPASMSMLEESTLAANRPTMSVFNNLVMFDQQVAQNSPKSIVPESLKVSGKKRGMVNNVPPEHPAGA